MPFEKPTSFRPVNTIQQDLFMLANGHYKCDFIDPITSVKLVLDPHVTNIEYLRTRDVMYWMAKEFYIPGIILPNREDLLSLLINPAGIHTHGRQQLDYEELVIYEMLDRIWALTCFKDNVWLLPFERPQPDPNIQDLLNAYQDYQAAQIAAEIPFSEEGREDLDEQQYETINFTFANVGRFLTALSQETDNLTWGESFYRYFQLDKATRPGNQRWAERMRTTRNATKAKAMALAKTNY